MGEGRAEPVVAAMYAATPKHPPVGPSLRHLLGDDLADDVAAALAGYRPRAREVGLPVLLIDGGHPWEAGNAWMRENFAGSDTNTREGYAGDLIGFWRWCEQHDIDPADADARMIQDFREARFSFDSISGGTWNRQLSAISNFLGWNEEQDGVKRLTASVRRLRVPLGSRPVEAVELDTYRVFRDAGLRGLTLQGAPDPDFPGMTGERNTLYANLIVSTGLRRQESALLLLFELPLEAEGREKVHYTWIPGVIAKGGKPRQVHLLDSFLVRYRRFLEGEWLSIVGDSQKAYRTFPTARADDFGDGRLRIDGHWIRTDAISVEERQRLVMTGELAQGLGIDVPTDWLVPVGLFPGRDQPIPQPPSWTKIFRIADARVQSALVHAGMPRQPQVTPHVLRHTYGVEYLRNALRQLEERAVTQVMTGDERLIRRHFENPINELRVLLGHERVETTLGYLHALRRSDPLESMPWSAWADELLSNEGNADA